ncbi:MAG: hypothetical protein QOI74_2447 [Micromonosporaceae bacterium]|jgi:capsular polysaccharide biosynthesis protein|nr:hypothetical protein [Micromonosporaceae bacterium]MDT5037888.1 hypothetical protein [Micromonosporaceae bacterium]
MLRRLVRQFGLLFLLALIGGVAGAVYGAVKTPAYTAKAYVVAVGEPGESITALNFAQAYGRIATSGPVVDKAAAALGADRTGLRQVTASTSPDAPVIEIVATGPGAKHTAAVANAMADALVAYGSARRTETRVGLAVLAAAATPKAPTSPKPPLELAVGAAGGLLIGGLAVLAGVGRSTAAQRSTMTGKDATRRTADGPAPYEVAAFDGPAPAAAGTSAYPDPPSITDNPSKAIAAYSAPSFFQPVRRYPASSGGDAVVADRVVGGAVKRDAVVADRLVGGAVKRDAAIDDAVAGEAVDGGRVGRDPVDGDPVDGNAVADAVARDAVVGVAVVGDEPTAVPEVGVARIVGRAVVYRASGR